MQIEVEQMIVSEILSKITNALSTFVCYSSNFNFRNNAYKFHGPLIKPNLVNRINYGLHVPFAFTSSNGFFSIIDLSKIEDVLETVIKEYYFTDDYTSRDAATSIFTITFERNADITIIDNLTDEHMQIIKNNTVVLNRVVTKLIDDNLVNQIEKL